LQISELVYGKKLAIIFIILNLEAIEWDEDLMLYAG
jgi:hypothetical protein